MAYRDVILGKSPHIYYEWATTSGTPTNAGSGSVSVSSGSVTTASPGATGSGYAAVFGGTSGYVSTTVTGQPLNKTTWAVELWFKRANTTDSGYMELVNYYDANNQIAIYGSANNKQVELWYNFGGAARQKVQGPVVSDTNWHHVVATSDGTNVRLYLDGTSVGTPGTVATPTFGSGTTMWIGAYGSGPSNENWNGRIDEVAVYTNSLSSTAVTQNYNAGLGIVHGGYTAQAMTGSGLSLDAIVRPRKLVTKFDDFVNPFGTPTGMTVSAASGDLVVTKTSSAGSTAFAPLSGYTLEQGGEMLIRVASGTASMSIGFNRGGLWSYSGTAAAGQWLRVRNLDVSGGRYKVWNDGDAEPTDWTGSFATADSGPASVRLATTSAASTTATLDLLSVNEATVASAPDVAIGAGVAMADASMPQPNVGGSTQNSATPSTGSGAMVDAVVSTESHPNVAVTVEPFTGSALMPAGGGFASPINIAAAVSIGSGLALDASVATDKNALVKATPATGSGYLEAPAEARNAENDPYFNEIVKTTDFDDRWYRLDEVSGAVAKASMGGSGAAYENWDAQLVGSYSFGVIGPEGRRGIKFSGGYMSRYQELTPSNEMAFEVVLRTTQKDGVLAYGLDPSPSGSYRNAILIQNGRINFNGVYSGVKDIADGQWHHIVVVWGHGNPNILDDGMRIFVDGKLDIRRAYSNVPNGAFAAPDWYFGMPDSMRPAGIPGNFVGDVMEVVYRYNGDLTGHEIQQLYYRAVGIVPIGVQPFTGSGVAGDAKGKGNQKRALVLYFDTKAFGTGNTDASERAFGWDVDKGDFDFGPAIAVPGMTNYVEKLQMAGYRVFFKGVDFNGTKDYRDYVTDMPRLLDLQQDVNVDEYDLILYKNWPDEGNELDRLFNAGFTTQNIEDHLESLRKAVDSGVSLWVSNPALANRLGIISRAELVPTMMETKFTSLQGDNQLNRWDDHAQAIDPWGVVPAYGAIDTHRNNRQRVVASIPGMTDIPSNVLLDALIWSPHDIAKWNNMFTLKYGKRPNGLQIGDEYMDITVFWNDLNFDEDRNMSGAGQYRKHVYAVPATAVLAGTPVTKFGAYTWEEGNKQVANPYADYVGTIVVQPGDSLKGRPVGGKILVTLSEDPRITPLGEAMEFRRQIVPSNEEIKNPLDYEGPEKRSWDFSTNRWLFGGVTSGSVVPNHQGGTAGGQQIEMIMQEDGTFYYKYMVTSPLIGITVSEKYPTEPVTILSMIQRGLKWLSERVITAPGTVNGRPAAATATGSMPQPTIRVEKSVSVPVQPALAIGQMVNAEEVDDPDVTILVLPFTAGAQMVQYEKKIVVEPFAGSGTMQETAEVKASRDSIVLFLLRPTQITVYKEDK